MVRQRQEAGNLWLARALWEVGAVRFGDFSIGRSTIHSPVYVNVRRIISRPRVMKRIAKVMTREIQAEMGRLRPRFHPFQLVAGVPMGGLHLATTFSLSNNIPMIYTFPPNGASVHHVIEGHYEPDQNVLLIDDLITSGGSVLNTADTLQQEGLSVQDVMVLIDRGEGATERLRHHGYNLYSMLTLEVMLNYYLTTGRIDENLHRKCCGYIQRKQEEAQRNS